MSVLALSFIVRKDDDPLILTIKYNESHFMFPGMFSFPGGYMKPRDGRIELAALREIGEKTGDKWFRCFSTRNTVGIIDSIPRPSCHNIIVLQVVHITIKDSDTIDDVLAKTTIQSEEIGSIQFFTLAQLREHHPRCTPGLQKILGSMNITKDGRVEWK